MVTNKKKGAGKAAASAKPDNVHPVEQLLGPTLLTGVGEPEKKTVDLLKGKDIVCLYFSASWCPPCKAFSPVLSEFYNECAKDGNMEIVYISSDSTIPDFEGYYKTMPFLSMTATAGAADLKNKLAETLQIKSIPMLIVLDAKTGEFIMGNARDAVTRVKGDKEKGMELIDSWKEMPRVPLEDAQIGGPSPGGWKGVIMFFTRNPMALFAIFYVLKQGGKYYRENIRPVIVNNLVKDEPKTTEVPTVTREEPPQNVESEF